MEKSDSTSIFFDDTTRLVFCMHRAYSAGFITRSGMDVICEWLYIEKRRSAGK